VINIHQFNEAVNKDRYNNFYNRNKGTNVSLITDSYGIPLSIECYRGNMNDCRVLTNHLTKQEVFENLFFFLRFMFLQKIERIEY
jgi:hypothetical protein